MTSTVSPSSGAQGSSGPQSAAAGAHAAEVPLPEVKMHLYRPNEPVTVKVTKNVLCTGKKAAAFVRHVEFDVAGTLLEAQVKPGQSIGVLSPGKDEKGRPHAVRLYSVASPEGGEDGQGKIISTTVKRTIDEHWESHKLFLGVCSNYLCDLQEGDEVRLSGPNGKKFLLPADPSAHDYLFFATGTGIAPFRGMVRDLAAKAPASKVALVMGSPYATDLIYDNEFNAQALSHKNFTYLTAISRERQRDGHDAMYVDGRLRTHREQLGAMLGNGRTLIYVCGIAGMELAIFQEMARMLPEEVLAQYLSVDPELHGEIDKWERKMVLRQIKPSKRVFLEVYA